MVLGVAAEPWSEAMGGHLTAIRDQGNAPAEEEDAPQRRIFALHMPLPGACHTDIGHQQQAKGEDSGGKERQRCPRMVIVWPS